MTDMRISAADTTGMTGAVPNFSVNTATQDTPGTNYIQDWSKWYGYYKAIPELQAVVDKKAMWTIGRGYKAKNSTKTMLDRIRGCGVDTFDSVLYNAVRTYTIGGDFYAEIIKNRRGELRNLKPLNPGSITVLSDTKGMITGYEQMNIARAKVASWKPDEILHLAWNRLGDECHGRSTIEKLEKIILMRNEAMTDMQIVFHRYVKPLIVTQVDTDDPAEIQALKGKLDRATANGENMIIPKDTVSMERMSIPQYSTLDPLPWIAALNGYFIMAEGVPMVILGGESQGATEAYAKTLYLAFQQVVEHNQLFIEQQLKAQLGIEIELEFPADIAPAVQSTVGKAHQGMNDGTGGNPNGRKTSGTVGQ